MARVSQEFHCGNCSGYFVVRLNLGLNHEVEIVCPGCGHEHRRCVKNGLIFEAGRFKTDSKEKIRPTKAAFSKTPITDKMKKAQYGRDGVELSGATLDEYRQRWLEVAARERGEDQD